MNRRKFLLGIGAAAVAAPVVVEALKQPSTEPLFVGTKDQYSKYLTSNTAWYLKDYPHGVEMVDWAERGRRYHQALQRSMSQTKRQTLTSAEFTDRCCVILNDSFTEVYGSSGL